MIVVVLLTIATGAVLLWALYTEQVPPPRPRHQGPRWAGLPSPDDIRRRDFPLAVGGYDPQAVDAHLRAVSEAYATVRARLASHDTPPDADSERLSAGHPWGPPSTTSMPAPPPPGSDPGASALQASRDRPGGREGSPGAISDD